MAYHNKLPRGNVGVSLAPTSGRGIPNRNGVLLFAFEDEDICTRCGKEPSVVGGLCVGCDHLQDDIRLDSEVGLI